MNRPMRGCAGRSRGVGPGQLRPGTNTVEVLVVVASLGLIGLMAWRLML